MSRRMIDPQTIIKSQIVNDKWTVDLHELLEKYGFQDDFGAKHVTLQFYSKYTADDDGMGINTDTSFKGCVVINTAITISNYGGYVYIRGLLVNDLETMVFIPYIEILPGDYENGIILENPKDFDVHVIKV